jgi:hypothetical protein
MTGKNGHRFNQSAEPVSQSALMLIPPDGFTVLRLGLKDITLKSLLTKLADEMLTPLDVELLGSIQAAGKSPESTTSKMIGHLSTDELVIHSHVWKGMFQNRGPQLDHR